jgi:LysM repeat protein
MGLFDRRKDATSSAPSTPGEPVAAEPVAAKKIAAAPPAPPAPEVAEPAPEPGQPEPPPASAPDAMAQPGPAIHTVAAGESLADLASRYGVPAEEIARQNHVPAPGQIYPGQVFVIRS